MESIPQLANRYPSAFLGEPKETENSLARVEASLGVVLPSDLRWLLVECGYGPVHAVPNIRQSVGDTIRFRQAVGLPHQYVVLDDRNDAGAVLLDTSSPAGRVIWADTHALGHLATGTLAPSQADFYESFAQWAASCLQEFLDESET